MLKKHVSIKVALFVFFMLSLYGFLPKQKVHGEIDSPIAEKGNAIEYTEQLSSPDHRFDPSIKLDTDKVAIKAVNTGQSIEKLQFFDEGKSLLSYSSRENKYSVWNVKRLEKNGQFTADIPHVNHDNIWEIKGAELTINGLKKRGVWDMNIGMKKNSLPNRPYQYSDSAINSASLENNKVSISKKYEKGPLEMGPCEGRTPPFFGDCPILPFLILPIDGEDVRKIRMSPNGAFIAIALEGTSSSEKKKGGRVQIWNIQTGKLTTEIIHPQATFTQLRFTPNSGKFLAGSHTGRIVVWDMVINKKHSSIQVGDGLRSLEISPDGQMFATGTTIHKTKNRTGIASLWNINSSKQIHYEWFDDYVASTAFGPLHTWYWAISSWNGDIKIIDLRKLGN